MLDKYEKDYANDPEFIAEGLAIKLTEEILEVLEQLGLSQSWLAEQMGVSRAHVSRILNARPNMTLLTIAKIAVALDVKPEVSLSKNCEVAQAKHTPRKQVTEKSPPVYQYDMADLEHDLKGIRERVGKRK